MMPELTAVAFSIASLHIPYTGQNQINPGIHLEAENYRAGIYRNSNNGNGLPATTMYVGYTLPLASFKVGGISNELGVLAALGRGYRSPVIGGLELRVGSRLVVLAAPPVTGASAVVGFGIRFPLDK